MPKTPPRSDAGRKARGASVIKLHANTQDAIRDSKAKLDNGQLADVAVLVAHG